MASSGEQFGVGVVFDGPAALEDEDGVGLADRRKAVGDDDLCAVDAGEVSVNGRFGHGVEVTGGLIEDRELWLA